MLLNFGLMALVLGLAMFLSVRTRKLTMAGALTGGLLGLMIYLGAGLMGIALVGLFFILGTAATAWQIDKKQGLGLAEKNKGRRTASQVVANAGVAGILGLLAWLLPAHVLLFLLMMAASLSAAVADTLSSEMGMVYGRRFYNILTFQKDKRGENGVVSLEGTLFGILGSTLIALVHTLHFGSPTYLLWIIIAGTVGNLADSLLGATLERKNYLSNDMVNFLNTLTGALTALLLSFL